MIKDKDKIEKIFLKIKENANLNNNVKNYCVKVSDNNISYIKLEIVVKEQARSWSNNIFIYINDNRIVITDFQQFFDPIVIYRDNLDLKKIELKTINKIISKYKIIHEYNEEECENGLYKIIDEKDIFIEIDNFIKCLKELSIALKIDSDEQAKIKYDESVKMYDEIQKEDKKFEYFRNFIAVFGICVLVIFVIFMIIHPFITIMIMCGIGMIFLFVECIVYLCTFWLPGGGLWKM